MVVTRTDFISYIYELFPFPRCKIPLIARHSSVIIDELINYFVLLKMLAYHFTR